MIIKIYSFGRSQCFADVNNHNVRLNVLLGRAKTLYPPVRKYLDFMDTLFMVSKTVAPRALPRFT